jgi:hypothetical protein
VEKSKLFSEIELMRGFAFAQIASEDIVSTLSGTTITILKIEEMNLDIALGV